MAEFNPFQSFSDNIKNYVDEQIKNSSYAEGDIVTIVKQYLNQNPQEADAISSDDVNEAITAYFEEHPVRTSTKDIKSAVDSYLESVPVNSNGGSAQKTVLDYGADPTGKTDSSEAFQNYANSNPTAFLIPSEGRFMINKTVDFGNSRPLVRSLSMNHFGGNGNKGTLFSGPDIGSDPMLKGVYWIENVSLKGASKTDNVGIELNAYEAKVIGCSVVNFNIGIRCDNAVHCVFRDNILVGNRKAVYAEGVCTINYFENNTSQYCDKVFDFNATCYGHTYISNTFERITDIPVMGKILYNATFINNWWEHTQNRDEDGNLNRVRAASTYDNQQMMKCFATGNSISVGFIDVFSGETGTHAGYMGGVSTDRNQVVIRESTGRALRIDDHSIIQELDDHSPAPDMTIRAGHALKRQKAAKMVMETGKGMPLYMYTYLKKDGEIEHWPARGINMYLGQKSDGSERFNKIEQSNSFGLNVTTDGKKRNSGDFKVRSSTVVPIKWTSDGQGTENLEMFSSVSVTETGTVRFDTSSQVNISSPVLNIQARDRGVRSDGFDLIDQFSNNNGCRGFILYFEDSSGNPVTPDEIHIQLSTS